MKEISTQVKARYDVDTGEYRVQHADNLDAFLRANERARKFEAEVGLKKDASYVFIGSVPMTVVLKIKDEHGIDLTNLSSTAERRRAFQIIERDYPKLKATNMRIG